MRVLPVENAQDYGEIEAMAARNNGSRNKQNLQQKNTGADIASMHRLGVGTDTF